MEAIQISVLSVLAVIFIVYRQMRTRPTARPGILYVGGAMIILGLITGGLIEPGQLALSIGLLVVEAAIAVGLGAWRATTVRVWLDASGVAWSKATGLTMLAWVLSVAARAGLYFAGTALGLTPSTSGILLFAGLTVAAQSYLVARRGRALTGTAGHRIPS
ncbi:hypothetical protein FH608_009605 [Nonomuraea phyllanthi]|uniref:Uncharacterized protein n=1 Tax=Nonomuraea phyllanthi TaxID=2219224 RepID=A0A5C4WRE6_9ACTN|nr:hypothetical protein [Nonomuraea phyllanthi]KAB8195758.1 hypothetical protein FH608_009605 [Nonomuraea phyllanthi]QFY07213.1 hypothetical protein GBF35_11400 [Nonomuraea phyllanthi]